MALLHATALALLAVSSNPVGAHGGVTQAPLSTPEWKAGDDAVSASVTAVRRAPEVAPFELRDVPHRRGGGRVVLQRSVGGVRLLEGDVVVTLDVDGRPLRMSLADVPPVLGTQGPVDAAAARAGLERAGDVVLGAPETGLVSNGTALVMGTRADVRRPRGDTWRVTVDAHSGHWISVARLDRMDTAWLYPVGPTFSDGAPCPTELVPDVMGQALEHTTCATQVQVELLNLVSQQHLSGQGAEVHSCRGLYTFFGASPANCPQLAAPDVNGEYTGEPDLNGASLEDPFSETSAYFYADLLLTMAQELDPEYPLMDTPLAVFTNVMDSRQGALVPFANAMFRPHCSSTYGRPCVALGQGRTVDEAYDGTVVTHELTHFLVHQSADFSGGYFGPHGVDQVPASLNEGTADALAAAWSGSPLHAPYAAREGEQVRVDAGTQTFHFHPRGFSRNLGEFRTCAGDGRPDPGNPDGRANPGLDGEEHDDGRIFGSLFWELHEGLAGVDATAVSGGAAPTCAGPRCNAAAVALLQTLRGQGPQPSFLGYGQALAATVRTLYGAAAGDYADCVVQRHDLASCETLSVAVHPGEHYTGLLFNFFDYFDNAIEGVPPQQAVVQNTFPADPAADHLLLGACAAYGTGTMYLRKDEPVALTNGVPTSFAFSVPIQADTYACLSNRHRTWIRLDADGCTYHGINDTGAGPLTVTDTPCVRGNQAGWTPGGTWYAFHTSTTVDTFGPYDRFIHFAEEGVLPRQDVAPASCLSLMPSGGRCVPLCLGALCGQPDGCGGTCEAGGGCLVPAPDGGVCFPLCLDAPCGADDTCGGTCTAACPRPDAGEVGSAGDAGGGKAACACNQTGGGPLPWGMALWVLGWRLRRVRRT